MDDAASRQRSPSSNLWIGVRCLWPDSQILKILDSMIGCLRVKLRRNMGSNDRPQSRHWPMNGLEGVRSPIIAAHVLGLGLTIPQLNPNLPSQFSDGIVQARPAYHIPLAGFEMHGDDGLGCWGWFVQAGYP